MPSPSPPSIICALSLMRTRVRGYVCSSMVELLSLSPVRSFCKLMKTALHSALARKVHPFWSTFYYFVSLSLVGSFLLMVIKPRDPALTKLRFTDTLYMSASAVTLSGLNSIDMELFSEAQVMVLTLLMLVGGEVFVSLLSLLFRTARYSSSSNITDPMGDNTTGSSSSSSSTTTSTTGVAELDALPEYSPAQAKALKARSLKYLSYVVFGYLMAFHVIGSLLVLLYLSVVPSARQILKAKGLRTPIFAVVSVVSSFANGGIMPTNENMAVFTRNPGLFLLLIPQILGGNTLYPVLLRLVLRVLQRLKAGRREAESLVKRPRDSGYLHLLPRVPTISLLFTVLGLVALQAVVLCSLNWYSAVFHGLSSWQKIVGAVFQSTNTRHAGEGAFSFPIVSPAVIVLFTVMMYLPAYTSFTPTEDDGCSSGTRRQDEHNLFMLKEEIANLSQSSYVAIFVVIACIIERKKLSSDPLNFSVLNIVFEIMSAYGNVGLSMGYSCERLHKASQGLGISSCAETSTSFSGRWSKSGKLFLVLVMMFGRLKRFHLGGGKAWKLS